MARFVDPELEFPLHKIELPVFADVKASLIDLSTIHPLASGNKYFKLAPNLAHAEEQGYEQMLSFGGAFSNHIHALALYAAERQLATIGIIRGEKAYANNPTLRAAARNGMQLKFVDRKTYRLRHDPNYLQQLAKAYPRAYIIPEGGSNPRAVEGCYSLIKAINAQTANGIDIFALACGSGGTLAGVSCGLEAKQSAIGCDVVNDASLPAIIQRLVAQTTYHSGQYELAPAHYAGYARLDRQLLELIMRWLEETGVLLDPIYSSKMARKIEDMLSAGQIKPRTHIGLLHTGGLQAWWGMREKVIKLGGAKGELMWQKIAENLPRYHPLQSS